MSVHLLLMLRTSAATHHDRRLREVSHVLGVHADRVQRDVYVQGSTIDIALL